MDEQLAMLIVSSASRAARELGDLAPLLKDQDEALKAAVASAVYDIMQNIVAPVLETNPQIEAAIDERIARYGRAF